jgi:hypothetical protein
MKELKIGCGKPTGAKISGKPEGEIPENQIQTQKEVAMSIVRVGQKATDFEALAYQDGKFGQIKL